MDSLPTAGQWEPTSTRDDNHGDAVECRGLDGRRARSICRPPPQRVPPISKGVALKQMMTKSCIICGGEFEVDVCSSAKVGCTEECGRRHRRNKEKAYRARMREANPALYAEKERAKARRQFEKDPERFRERWKRRREIQSAAVRLVRELQTKGLEALL